MSACDELLVDLYSFCMMVKMCFTVVHMEIGFCQIQSQLYFVCGVSVCITFTLQSFIVIENSSKVA